MAWPRRGDHRGTSRRCSSARRRVRRRSVRAAPGRGRPGRRRVGSAAPTPLPRAHGSVCTTTSATSGIASRIRRETALASAWAVATVASGVERERDQHDEAVARRERAQLPRRPAGDLDDRAFDLGRVVCEPAPGRRVGERLEVRLHGAHLRDVPVDRPLDLLRDRVGLVEREVARELQVQRRLDPVVGVDQRQVVELADVRDGHRGRPHPLAELAVGDASARRGRRCRCPGRTRCTAASTRSAAACPWPTAAPGETPITTSANVRPAACRSRSRRSTTGGSRPTIAARAASRASAGARSIEHVDVSADQARGGERRRGRRRRAPRSSHPPGSRRARRRGRRAPRACAKRSEPKCNAFEESAALSYRRAARYETSVRERSIATTTASATNAHQAGSTSSVIHPASRATASAADEERDEHEERRLRERREMLGLAVTVEVRLVGGLRRARRPRRTSAAPRRDRCPSGRRPRAARGCRRRRRRRASPRSGRRPRRPTRARCGAAGSRRRTLLRLRRRETACAARRGSRRRSGAPPASSTRESVSESSTTAIAAARNGWRLAARVARAGPMRSSARNQSSFVTTSGPSTANAKSSQTVQPRPQSWLES